jgi:hypothetical protein
VSAYLYGIAGGVILCLLATIWWQHGSIGRLKSHNAELTLGLGKALSANKDQKSAIDQLQTANAEWATKATVQHQAYMGALADLTRSNVARQALEKSLLAKEAHDRVSLACKQLLDVDISGPCPGIADAIRLRAK